MREIAKRTFNIDDLSQVIPIIDHDRRNGKKPEQDEIPIEIDLGGISGEKGDIAVIVDSLSEDGMSDISIDGIKEYSIEEDDSNIPKYRIGVVGMSDLTLKVYEDLSQRLREVNDIQSAELKLRTQYFVYLLGCRKPQKSDEAKAKAEDIKTRIEGTAKPNLFILVNANNDKKKLCNFGMNDLLTLTNSFNKGGFRGQKPFSLVFMAEEPIPQRRFRSYQNSCSNAGIEYAMAQFTPLQMDALAGYIRTDADAFAMMKIKEYEVKKSNGDKKP